MNWLEGKKTYLAALASVAAAWIGVWAGTVDIATAWQMTQVALIGSTIRHGVATGAK